MSYCRKVQLAFPQRLVPKESPLDDNAIDPGGAQTDHIRVC